MVRIYTKYDSVQSQSSTDDSTRELEDNLDIKTETSDHDNKNIIIANCCIIASSFLFGTNGALVQLSNLTVSQLSGTRFFVQFIIGINLWIFNKPANYKSFYG
eukprot:493300_1